MHDFKCRASPPESDSLPLFTAETGADALHQVPGTTETRLLRSEQQHRLQGTPRERISCSNYGAQDGQDVEDGPPARIET